MTRSLAIALVLALSCAAGLWLYSHRSTEPLSTPPALELQASDRPEPAPVIESEPIAGQHIPAAPPPRVISSKPDPIVGPKATLSARLLDARTSAPLADVPMQVQRPAAADEVLLDCWGRRAHEWILLTDPYFGPRTDRDGRIGVEVPAGVPLRVCITPIGATLRAEALEVAALAEGEAREVELHAERATDLRFTGRVVDSRTHAALDGVELSLIELGQSLHATTTDSSGRFDTPITSWRVAAARFERPGYVPLQLEFQDGIPNVAQEVLLVQGATVKGRLLDSKNGTLPVGAVRLWNDAGFESSCFCDSVGRFEIPGLPPGVGFQVDIESRSHRILSVDPLPPLEPGETRVLELRTQAGRRITGIAIDENHKPVPSVQLCLLRVPAGGLPCVGEHRLDLVESRVLTQADGAFAFEGVFPGTWAIAPYDRAELPSHPMTIQVTDAESPPIVLVIPGNARIRGRVVDADGHSAANAWVEISLEDCEEFGVAVCDADGSFTAQVRGPWPYRLRARTGKGAVESESARASAGDWNVLLQLKPVAQLALQLVDPAGARLEGAECYGVSESGLAFQTSFEADGRSQIALPPGSYRFLVQSGDGRWSALHSVTIAASPQGPIERVELLPPSRIRVESRGFGSEVELEILREGIRVSEGNSLKPASRIELDVPQGMLSIGYRLRGSGTDWKRVTIEARRDETAGIVLEP